MIVPSELSSLLSARPIVLWVEDELTKEYLLRVWRPDDRLFQIIVGGSMNSVIAVVNDLREAKECRHVFGLIDRDFRDSDKSKWHSDDVLVLQPTVMEIENFLLSWEALAGCDQNTKHFGRTIDQISQRAQQEAQRMTWWMACRTVLSDVYGKLIEGFPEHPKIDNIQDKAQAETYILNHSWHGNFPAKAKQIQNKSSITKDLVDAHTLHQKQLSDDTWISEYSGKEIFRHIRGYLFNRVYDSPESMDEDLAKSVGEWQITNGKVPQELIELKNAIKSRVGL